MLEQEYKILLSKEDYIKVEKLFNFTDAFTQINFFYKEIENAHLDTTIRIRAKKEKLFLQVKQPIEKKQGIHIKKEYQKELNVVPYKIEGKILNSLCATDIYEDCFLLGVLITERKILELEKCEIALDVNYYGSVIDYELEIEYEEEIDPKIIQILSKENLYIGKNSDGKYTRFVKQYYEMQKNSTDTESQV